jgi:hypothetical protein
MVSALVQRAYPSHVKIFPCQSCGQLLDFENTRCERCGRALGFVPERGVLSALEPVDHEGRWRALAAPGEPRSLCANAAYDACNWLVPPGNETDYCLACQLNRTIPRVDDPDLLARWRKVESAKHRLIYALLRLRLPLSDRPQDPAAGLRFDFVADDPHWAHDHRQFATGHARGVITINVAEADDVERERDRQALAEPYRTLLGHFRHESGHYIWERLVVNGPSYADLSQAFGDSSADYAMALQGYYENGPPVGWRELYITPYASSHPLEDWAESWAHYLHMLDTLETAQSYGFSLGPVAGRESAPVATVDFDPYESDDFERLLAAWVPLTGALNGLSRSLGQPDMYPFVLHSWVIEKLRRLHEFVRRAPD